MIEQFEKVNEALDRLGQFARRDFHALIGGVNSKCLKTSELHHWRAGVLHRKADDCVFLHGRNLFLQRIPGGGDVQPDLVPQGLRIWEEQAFSQEPDRFHADFLSVEISLEIKEM